MDDGDYLVDRKLDSENVKEVLPWGGASFLLYWSNEKLNSSFLKLDVVFSILSNFF